MNWKELITDPNGTLSHTKIWSNIGMATITITFIVGSYTHGPSSELMLTYGSIVVAGRISSKYLDTKTVPAYEATSDSVFKKETPSA